MKVFQKISKIEKSLQKLCKKKYVKLLLLNLLLFIEYEETYIFLSDNSYEIIRNFMLMFIDNLPDSYMDDLETIEIIDILFKVSSKIYNTNIKKDMDFDLSLLKFSLMNEYKNTSLYNVRNFWSNYFSYKFQQLKEIKENPKMKIVEVTELMIYYNFFLSQDIEFTLKFIEVCLPVKSVNFYVIKRSCILKIKQELYLFNKNLLEKRQEQKRLNKKQKVLTILKLIITKNFFVKKEVTNLLSLNKFIKAKLSKTILKFWLKKIPTNSLKRKELWINYINLHKKKNIYLRHEHKVIEIDKKMMEQIKIDVLRTKHNKGEKYQSEIEEIIVEFFEHYDEKLEYFQGFNYMTSFLFEYFEEKSQVLKILDFISNYIIKDYFYDNLTLKLNTIHFQINNLVKFHFPDLFVHWLNININSEILFSGFIISLFTSLLNDDTSIVLIFFDIILIEKWVGVIKCVLYIIDLFYEDLTKTDANETLNFFTEVKHSDILNKKLQHSDFKKFVENFNFNYEIFFEMEIKFTTINKNQIN